MVLSACYRQSGKETAAVLLQQYLYRKFTVSFSCVCRGTGEGGNQAGAYMAGQMLQWFRALDPEKLAQNPEKAIRRAALGIGGTIRRIDRELENGRAGTGRTGFAGFFCIGSRYMMFGRGDFRICTVNTAFGRAYMRRLLPDGYRGEAAETAVEAGILQPGIGLLLATESFYGHIPDAVIKEGLYAGGGDTEDGMRRRLKELAEEGARRGAVGIGAVYLRTV